MPLNIPPMAQHIKNLLAIQETGDASSISGSGRSPGEENGNPLQYPCLKNPMDRGAWRAIVHSVKESNTHAGEIRQSMLNQVGKSE